jgi:hypothetical protein
MSMPGLEGSDYRPERIRKHQRKRVRIRLAD